MTDMFTMLLVFLLQTYSSSDVQLELDKDIRLPTSTTDQNPVAGPKLFLSTKTLKFETKTIAELNEKHFKESDIDSTDSDFIKPLFDELDQLAKKDSSNQAIKEGKILLQADASLPYSVIRKVMYTSSMAGYPNLKMVTTAQ